MKCISTLNMNNVFGTTFFDLKFMYHVFLLLMAGEERKSKVQDFRVNFGENRGFGHSTLNVISNLEKKLMRY